MKYFFTILIVLSFQKVSSQTLDETLDWLNFKLQEHCENTISGTFKISIKDDDDYGKFLFFSETSINPFSEKKQVDYYSVLPKNIKEVQLSTKSRTNNTLDIYIVTKSNNIYRPKEKDLISEISIYMKNGDNEMTKRIKKGLLHLLELMGNKIEPREELFKN